MLSHMNLFLKNLHEGSLFKCSHQEEMGEILETSVYFYGMFYLDVSKE